MTTQTAERETIVAQLVRFGQEQKGQKQVTVFEFKDKPDSQYATRVTWWPSKDGDKAPDLKIGGHYKVVFEKTPVPLRADGKGGKGHYRDFISAVPATGEPLGVQRAPAPAAAPQPDALVGYDAPAAGPAAPDLYTQGELRRELSFQRRDALKAAVEWACARVAAGEKVNTYHIGQMAQWFERILDGSVTLRPMMFKQAEAALMMTNEEAVDTLFGPEHPRPAAAPSAAQDAVPHGPTPSPAQAAPVAPAAAVPAPVPDPLLASWERGLLMAAQFEEFTPAVIAARRLAWKNAGDDKAKRRVLLFKLSQDVGAAKTRVEQETGLPFDDAEEKKGDEPR